MVEGGGISYDACRPTRKCGYRNDVIGAVTASDLMSRREIQGYEVTGLEAIYHVVEHFSMHTGQIILLSKARIGQDLKLWEPAKKV